MFLSRKKGRALLIAFIISPMMLVPHDAWEASAPRVVGLKMMWVLALGLHVDRKGNLDDAKTKE